MLVQNIENGKLHRQDDSRQDDAAVKRQDDAWLNRESKSHVFFSVGHFIAYMKVSKEKLFMLRMTEFLVLLSSLE